MDDLQDQENSDLQAKMIQQRGHDQAELIKDYQRTFEQGPGKKVLQDLFKRFGFLTTTAAGDPHQTYYNEGQRAVILFIVHQMKLDSNKILEQLQAIKMGG